MMHYNEPDYIKNDDGSWKLEAPCGFVVLAPGHDLRQYMTDKLSDITCEKCLDIYALEILAEVP